MAATTRRPEDGAPSDGAPSDGAPRGGSAAPLLRFDAVERTVHWINAVLFLILVFTGAVLYLEPLQAVIGRRALVQDIHLYCGIALPVPVLIAVAGYWGKSFRRDLKRLNRWSGNDRRWLARALRGRYPLPKSLTAGVGKFNAGQKLNAAFVAGAGLVMLGTGLIMHFYHPWPLSWRTGATFVHDWLALFVGFVIIGHIGMALRDSDSLRSMIGGRISRGWAERHAPLWAEEITAKGAAEEGRAVPADRA